MPLPRTLQAADVPRELRNMIAQAVPLLLAGTTEAHATLRSQYELAQLREVELTGVGYFAQFDVPTDALRVAVDHLIGGSVEMDVAGLPAVAGALLIVMGGKLDALEVYTFADVAFPLKPVIRVRASTPIEMSGPVTQWRSVQTALLGERAGGRVLFTALVQRGH